MSTIFQKRLAPIKAFFSKAGKKVYTKKDFTVMLKNNQGAGWDLPEYLTTPNFIKELLENTSLKKVVFQPTNDNKAIERFLWGEVSSYEVALSLKPNSYLSHGTAVYLHGLNDQIPRAVYVNKEQSIKQNTKKTKITQAGIDHAFAGAQRTSLYEINYKGSRIYLLNGKNTGNLDVSEVRIESGETVFLTKIERTLIDIAVRPSYAGGVYQVLSAYKGAKGRISVSKISTLLEKMSYAYPYHQAIGFYLKKAGFSERSVESLKKIEIKFDFYLDYGINNKNREYDEEWRLFYPKGL